MKTDLSNQHGICIQQTVYGPKNDSSQFNPLLKKFLSIILGLYLNTANSD